MVSEDSEQSDPDEEKGRGSSLRLALLLAAAATIIFAVLAQNLLLVGLGLLAAIAAFRVLPDSIPMIALPASVFIVAGALLLAGAGGILSYQDVQNPLIPALWIGSMVLALVAALKMDRALPQATAEKPRTVTNYSSHLWLIPIILVAFALRIHRLETYPPLHGDEGEMGLAALRVLAGDAPPPTATGWLDHPALFHYLQAVPLALFGRSGFGLRLVSVIAGVLCVPLVYDLGRRWWGPLAGLSAAWFLAVAHLHVHFSRLGLNNIESVLFLLLFLVLMTRARPHRVTVYLLAGLTVGLAQYMYYGSRVILLIAPLLLLFTWRTRMSSPRQLAAFGVGLTLAILPLAAFFGRNPDPLVNRARGVFVMNGDNVNHILQSEQASLPADLLPLLTAQLRRNVSFFAGAGDRSPFYIAEVPGLDMLITVMFWLGLGLALTRLFRLPEYTVLLTFGLGLLFGGVLTIDAPNAPRLLMVIPAVVLLAGLVVQRGARLLSAYPRWAQIALLLVVITLAGLLNIKIYFGDFGRILPPGNQAADLIAREIDATGESAGVYLMGQPILYANYGTVQFLAGDHVQDFVSEDELPTQSGQELLFIALPRQAETLERIKEQWPGGQSSNHRNANDLPLYSSYHVSVP